MSTLLFSKYQGTGNDFLIGDNREGSYTFLTAEQIQRICDRRLGVGADGLILLESATGADFLMRYFNADGQPGSFCGNGARCITEFAFRAGLIQQTCTFLATDGLHRAQREENGTISLLMQPVTALYEHTDGQFVDTGSPHLVVPVTELDHLDVATEGRSIRNTERYRSKGVNVNFVQRTEEAQTIRVRTYERGVENETYSCGTGAVAAALCCAEKMTGSQQITVLTKGGTLQVRFKKDEAGYAEIWLCGPATYVFETTLDITQMT
jgi:diaminopimelate epimerase